MYCSHCGKELREAAAFCVFCGMSVEQMTMPVGQRTLPAGQRALPKTSNKKAALIVGICVGVALLMFALMVLAFSLPAIFAARDAASRMQCSTHMRIIGIALHNYHDEHGALPPLYTVDEEGNPLHSWRVLILPFIGHQRLYDQIRLDEPWDSNHNRQFHDQMPRFFKCPRHPGDPLRDCTYAAVAGLAFFPAEEAGSIVGLRFQDFTEELSDIFALVEVREAFNWMDPTADSTLENIAQGNRMGSYHSGGDFINVVFLDAQIGVFRLADLRNAAAHRIEQARLGNGTAVEPKNDDDQ